LGIWVECTCEATEEICWTSYSRWSSGANGNETVGQPLKQGEELGTTLFQPLVAWGLGCINTWRYKGIPTMLGWGYKRGLTSGGGGWKCPWTTRFRKYVCWSWLKSSESTSKWIENFSLLFLPLCQPTFCPLFQFPLFSLLSMFPLL